MRGVDFYAEENQKPSPLSQRMQSLKKQIARLKSTLARERCKVKSLHQLQRKLSTRGIIQIGGLFHKSGLVDAFLIVPDDDLQDYKNLGKAARLLGFLSTCFENNSFDEESLESWGALGKRLLKYE